MSPSSGDGAAIPVRRIRVPTPYPIGPTNAWLVPLDPVTVVDPGPNTPEARAALFDGLAAEGVAVDRVRRVVVTHAHPDHYGLAPAVRDRSGCRILVGERDLPKLAGVGMLEVAGPLLELEGVPARLVRDLGARERALGELHVAVDDVRPLAGGERLAFDAGGRLEVLPTPGHTGGHVCLHDGASGTLFAGDTLLPDVTPNPLIEPDGVDSLGRRTSLVEYLDTLDRLAGLGLARALPGHGEPVDDVGGLIARTREHHRRRLEAVAGLLGARARTGWELAGDLFPSLRDFDQILAVSEVVAHLDVLVAAGRAVSEVGTGIRRYRAA